MESRNGLQSANPVPRRNVPTESVRAHSFDDPVPVKQQSPAEVPIVRKPIQREPIIYKNGLQPRSRMTMYTSNYKPQQQTLDGSTVNNELPAEVTPNKNEPNLEVTKSQTDNRNVTTSESISPQVNVSDQPVVTNNTEETNGSSTTANNVGGVTAPSTVPNNAEAVVHNPAPVNNDEAVAHNPAPVNNDGVGDKSTTLKNENVADNPALFNMDGIGDKQTPTNNVENISNSAEVTNKVEIKGPNRDAPAEKTAE